MLPLRLSWVIGSCESLTASVPQVDRCNGVRTPYLWTHPRERACGGGCEVREQEWGGWESSSTEEVGFGGKEGSVEVCLSERTDIQKKEIR